MAAPKTKLHFSRFEFKYVLPQGLCDEFQRELQYFVELDPFVDRTAEKRYFVRSLYFDNPQFEAYYEKIDGLRTREKFRLRTYTNDPAGVSPQFLEIKGRHNNLVFKHRAPLAESVATLENGEARDTASKILALLSECDIKSKFIFALFRKQIRPIVLIDYLRRPYVSKYDPEFRVTFDSNLSAVKSDSLFPKENSVSRRLIPGHSVMEVKFRYHVPAWFHRLLQAYELERTSISKVCTGVKAWEMTADLS